MTNKTSLAAFGALNRTTAKLVLDWNMWQKGDAVALGFSGGKDSFALLHFLTHTQEAGLPACEVSVFHVPPPARCPCAKQADFIPEFLTRFQVKRFEVLTANEAEMDTCDRCARFRRKSLFEACVKHQISVLALAHHQDDLVQTYLLNVLFHGELSGTMIPKRFYQQGALKLIRPFLTTPEKRIIFLARKLGFPFSENSDSTQLSGKRAQIREFLMKLGRSRDLVKTNLARLASMEWLGRECPESSFL